MKILIDKKFFKWNSISFLFLLATVCKFGNNSVFFSIVFFLVFLLELFFSKKNSIKYTINAFSNQVVILGAFFISIISTLINSYLNGKISVNYLFELLLFGLLMVFGCFLLVDKGQEYIYIGIKQISWFLVICCILGIYEYLLHTNVFLELGLIDGRFIKMNQSIIVSAFIHPIVYGNCLLIPLLYFAFTKKTILNWCALFLTLINIVLTQSRSSWLSLIFVCFLCVIRSEELKNLMFKKNRLLSFLIVIITVTLIFTFSSVPDLIFSRLDNFSKYLSPTYQRIGSILYIFGILSSQNIFKFLFGSGSHQSANVMLGTTIQWDDFSTTDNLYLADLYNFGIIYLMCVVVYFLFMTKTFLKKRSTLDSLILALLISFEVVFFFYEPFVFYPVMLSFFLFLGVSIGLVFQDVRL